MASTASRRHFIVVGLGFGDEGKGLAVDYLTRRHDAGLLVRFNGGAQAAHNVVTPEGVHHTFAQFGSGTLAKKGIVTLLTEKMLVNPQTALSEAEALREKAGYDPLGQVVVDGRCWITTSYHRMANLRQEDDRTESRHGTTGMGIGETRRLAEKHGVGLRVCDLTYRGFIERKMTTIRDFYDFGRSATEEFEIDALLEWKSRLKNGWEYFNLKSLMLETDGPVVWEGAQGVLLDQNYGFHPHTTWSDTTSALAEEMIAAERDSAVRVGVLRTYSTRHGEGPFPAGRRTGLVNRVEPHNDAQSHAGAFRTGPFDLCLARYALSINPVDCLFLTHMDFVSQSVPVIYGYDFSPAHQDIDPYFNGCVPRRPPFIKDGYHAHMEAIGRRLDLAQPRVKYVNRDSFPLWLSNNLGVPVRYISRGNIRERVQEIDVFD